MAGICLKETTTARQFAEMTKYGIKALWPVESGKDKGSHIGAMQMPVSMVMAWDWVQNTQKAVDLFNGNLTQSDTYVKVERKKKGFEKLPDLTDTQREDNALSLYRIGNYYYVPNKTKDGWIEDADNKVGVAYAKAVRENVPK